MQDPPFIIHPQELNSEQLQVLNALLQAFDYEQRQPYLQSLGENFYEKLRTSEHHFIDERDYNIYSVVKIGEQRWLGENLRYKGCDHWVNDEWNMLYGCFYQWKDLKDACPSGCSIPREADWKRLEQQVLHEFSRDKKMDGLEAPFFLGDALRALYAWEEFEDTHPQYTQFNAYPTGCVQHYSKTKVGTMTAFWSLDEVSKKMAYGRQIPYVLQYNWMTAHIKQYQLNKRGWTLTTLDKDDGYALRCLVE